MTRFDAYDLVRFAVKGLEVPKGYRLSGPYWHGVRGEHLQLFVLGPQDVPQYSFAFDYHWEDLLKDKDRLFRRLQVRVDEGVAGLKRALEK